METLLLLLAALTYFVSGAQEDILCNAVWDGTGIYPIDTCFATRLVAGGVVAETSKQYACLENNSGVELRTFNDIDCVEIDDSLTVTVQTNTDFFQCGKSKCPHMEARVHTATKDGDTCIQGESFTELALPSHFCFLGNKFVCTATSAQKQIYWEGDNDAERWVDFFNVLQGLSQWKTKLNCTATVQSDVTIWESGCDAAGTSYTTVEFCSIAADRYHYSLLILLVVVATFVF
eukprot:UN13130